LTARVVGCRAEGAGVRRPAGHRHVSKLRASSLALIVSLAVAACGSAPTETGRLVDPWVLDDTLPPSATPSPPLPSPSAGPSLDPILRLLPPTREPGAPILSPTPDPLRTPPSIRATTETYVVQAGDSLNSIAGRFGVGSNVILAANRLANPNFLPVGMVLTIPPPVPQRPGPSFKILPDSELVDGPASARFDVGGEVSRWNGALARYTEKVEDRNLSGAEIVALVARRYSVNPRLLLAVLEHQGGFLRSGQPRLGWTYAVGHISPGHEGLFSQLSWAADQLNTGYYLWRAGWSGPLVLADGSTVLPGLGINAGTAGVEYFFAQLDGGPDWRAAVDEGGFYQTFVSLFGIPFDRTVEPLLPAGLTQPALQLPIETGTTWSFTGGPHSAWGSGAAWAAIDFAPPGYALGCVSSDEWVVAAADGLILRADQGEVIEDLDADGFEQTGWVILYMHVESRDRVSAGAYVHAGDRLGHPSCEGGVSNGTHLHMARKYNGEWIPADGSLPFVMDGWVSAGTGAEYDGTMTRGGVTLEACACRNDGNQISR
jgi:LasA protease